MVDVVTPNTGEVVELAGEPVPSSVPEAAGRLIASGAAHVLVTGGTADGGVCEDRLFSAGAVRSIAHRAIAAAGSHGTGCLHSSSIACRLAQGATVPAAAEGAARWMGRALERAVAFGAGGAPDGAMPAVDAGESVP